MKDKINCAICGDVAELKSIFDDFFVGKINKKIHVNFYSYQCDACEESFTTNKIDQLNLNNIERGIRNYKRMLKIKQLIK
jgi:hypothetical protein